MKKRNLLARLAVLAILVLGVAFLFAGCETKTEDAQTAVLLAQEGMMDPCPGDACPGTCCSTNTGGTTDPCPSDACPGTCCSTDTGGTTDPCPSDACPGTCCSTDTGDTTDPCPGDSCPGTCCSTNTGGTTACSTGQYWDAATSSCKSSGATTCSGGQIWDTATNSCKSSGTTTTCPTGQYWDSTLNYCKSSGTTACSGGQIWDAATNSCKSSGTTTTTCPTGQYWDSTLNYCKSSGTTTMTQATCTQQGGTWINNGCDFTSAQYGTNLPPVSGEMTQASCTQQGGTWTNNGCNFPYTTGTNQQTQPGAQFCPDGSPVPASRICPTTTTTQTNQCGYGSTWDSTEGRCIFQTRTMSAECTDPWQVGQSKGKTGCEACGWHWDTMGLGGKGDCFPQASMTTGMDTTRTTIGYCERPAYFDQFKQTCVMPDTSKFTSDTYECPEWDMWCQKKQQMGQMSTFDENYVPEWEQEAQCLNARDAKLQKSEIQSKIELIQDAFETIDRSQTSDSYVIMDATNQLKTVQAINLDDPCELGKAREFLNSFNDQGGLGQELRKGQEVANFKREVNKVIQELQREGRRIKNETALGYIQTGIEKANAILANPPYNPEEPWKMWESLDPECFRNSGQGPMPMNMGMMGPMNEQATGGMFGEKKEFGIENFMNEGPQFGPPEGPGFGPGGPGIGPLCSVEELIADETPRGYLSAAVQLDDQNRNKQFEQNVCKDSAHHIAKFKEYILPQLLPAYQTQGSELMLKAESLLEKCKTAKDKYTFMKYFQQIGADAEKLIALSNINVSELDFGDEDSAYGEKGFDFGDLNLASLTSEDLMAKINALIEKKVQEAIGKVMEKVELLLSERLTEMLAIFGQRVVENFTTATEAISTNFKDELANDLATTFEYSINVREDATDTAETQAETLTNVVNDLVAIKEADEEVKGDVQDVIEVVAERPLPVSVLNEVQNIVDKAQVIVANGGDPAEKLQEVPELLNSFEDKELNILQAQEGTWQYVDVTPGVNAEWYAPEVGRAWALGVAEGTEVNVEIGGEEVKVREFAPSKTLNVTEGTAMIFKAAGLAEATPTAEVKALGVPEWGQGMVQAVVDEVGINKVKEAFAASGGAGGPMKREVFADVAVGVYENNVGTISVDPNSEIGQYQDFGKMDTDTQHDFAVAHEMGMITGADGGTRGNPEGIAIRAEAAKMLSRLKEAMEEVQYTGSGRAGNR